MKDPYLYIIESIICSGLFLAVYRLCIVQATGFRVSRFFLLLTMIGACAIPLLQIPVWSSEETVFTLPIWGEAQKSVSNVGSENVSTGKDWLMIGYFFGVIVMMIRMFIPLSRAMRLKHRTKVLAHGGYYLVVSEEVKDAFSSLRTVFLPVIADKDEEKMVLVHEEGHLRHFHIAERWVMELLKTLCWFNPFVWIASRKLVEMQEMEVDADVLSQGFDLTEYREVLLKQVMGLDEGWVCAFSPSFMKKRLLAMTAPRKIQNFRKWLMVPMLGIALVCFGFRTKPVSFGNESGVGEVTVVTGKVVDEQTGVPIVGAIVMEMGSANGTVTDGKGEFHLTTQVNKELKVMMIEYDTWTLRVDKSGKQTSEIKLTKTRK